MNIQQLKRQIIKDFAVEVGDECDRNFVRKAFFDRPWAPVKAANLRGSLLLRSGALRSSLRYTATDSGVEVSSDTPYAAIHNEGGVITRDITVTDKMRRWAWARWHTTKDNKFKAMALTRKKRLRQTIRIPERRFVGEHPKLSKALEEIARDHLGQYVDIQITNMTKK